MFKMLGGDEEAGSERAGSQRYHRYLPQVSWNMV
jgi:hypothetical protein